MPLAKKDEKNVAKRCNSSKKLTNKNASPFRTLLWLHQIKAAALAHCVCSLCLLTLLCFGCCSPPLFYDDSHLPLSASVCLILLFHRCLCVAGERQSEGGQPGGDQRPDQGRPGRPRHGPHHPANGGHSGQRVLRKRGRQCESLLLLLLLLSSFPLLISCSSTTCRPAASR